MNPNEKYSIFVSEMFPLICSLLVLLYGMIYSASKRKYHVVIIMIAVMAGLLYGGSFAFDEQDARESSCAMMQLYELNPCTVPIQKYFIFNISDALAVKCEEHNNFQFNADVEVAKKLEKWALQTFDIYVENIAFSNLREYCRKMPVESAEYNFFNCSRRVIAPEDVPGFDMFASRILPGECKFVTPQPTPMYNMRYTNANCPMRFMRPYVLAISLTALAILLPLSLFYGKWI
jgi:hypothetical protein